jgi:hypothetical protein
VLDGVCAVKKVLPSCAVAKPVSKLAREVSGSMFVTIFDQEMNVIEEFI